MSPVYAYGEPSPHTYRPYYWAPPNVRGPQPISALWPEPYYSYRESPGNYYWPPHDCGFKYGASPYWQCPPEHQFYKPKFRNYEGDGRDFRPYTYAPPPSSFVYSRPFNPNEQFRQPDDYPMRFAPATGYDRFGHYPFEQHCCGCPNHVAYPKPVERIIDDAVDEKRIKDFKDSDGKWMTDDTEKKGSENLQKFPEPIVWIPGSLSDRNEERHPVYWVPWNRKSTEGDPERPFPGYWIPLESNTASRDRKTEDENAEEKHPVYWVPWNRKSPEGDRERPFPGYWIPLDSNTGSRDRKTEDENAMLPSFPIFWIPRKFEGEGDAKVQNPPQESKKTEGLDASNVEHVQQKSIKTNGGEADMLNEGINGRPAQQKREEAGAREVPVKQLEEKEQDASKVEKLEQKAMKINGGEAEKINEGVNGRSSAQKKEAVVAREIPVKRLGEEGKPSQAPKEERVSKVSDDNHHVKKASSPRASKLPPVCLRVDPPPRQKTNGTSYCRSPSPPHKEEESKDKVAEKAEGNANVSRTSSSRYPSPPRKVEESKDKVAVKAEGNANASASKVDRETNKDEQQSNASASNVGIETKKNEQQTNPQGKGKKQVTKKIEIGQDQAAVKIQALYRGYQVRKFQPLTKLREIMKIKGRVEDLRQQMSSPKFFEEICRDSKARGKFNETPMGLLLQLDTIQGLHPVVRDVRKSVARDLITLQEKLDTLIEQAGANKLQEAIRQTAESDKIATAEKTEDTITTSEVREILDDITNGNNQRIDSAKAINGVNVENKGSVNLGMLEIENKATKDVEDVEEKEAVRQDVLQVQNEAVKEGNDIEKAPIKQEGCLYATAKEIKCEEKVETVNQDNNVTGEKDLISVPAEATSDNATAEERVESGSSNVMLEEKMLDSAVPKEEVANEKLSSEILGQEHGIVDVENENLLDSSMPGEEDFVNEKLPSVALEKEQAIVDTENEKPEDSAVPKEDVVNEKLSSVILGQDHGMVDVENEKMLDSSLPVEEDAVNEKLPSVALEKEQAIVDIENKNPEDSAVLKEDVVNEILSSVTLEHEQAVVDIENERILDLSLSKEEDVNEKLLSVAFEKRQAVGDDENEKLLDLPQPKEADVFNKKRSLVSLEQKQAFEDVENVNFFEKTAMVGEDNSIITAPAVEIDQEKISEIRAAPVSDRNEGEREVSHALTDGTEECHDNDKRELTEEVHSLTISHVIKENNLSRLEETLPSNENEDGKEPPAAAETQNIGKLVETVNTPEAGLSVQNEEDLIAEEELLLPEFNQPVEGNESTQRCEILQKTESGTAKMEDKHSIDSKYLTDSKVEDAHVVNTNESESRSLQCEKKLQEGKNHEKWMEENEKLREMVEKLMSAGKCQMSTILQLNNKIKQLENKLSQGKSKRKVRAGQVKLKNNVTATNRRNSTARGT